MSALVFVFAGAFVFEAGHAQACGVESGGWTSIPAPSFGDGEQKIADYSVAASDADLVYVTNGRDVLKSQDGACSFRKVFALDEDGLSYDAGDARIVDLVVDPNDPARVYLAVRALQDALDIPFLNPLEGQTIYQPHVITTSDGGESWHEADGGLEAQFGAPLEIVPSTGDATYLLVASTELDPNGFRVATARSLWVNNGGDEWRRTRSFGTIEVEGATTNSPIVNHVEVDPLDDQDLWLSGPDGLFHSTDGGTSLTRMPLQGKAQRIGIVDVFHDSAENAPVVHAFAMNLAEMHVSINGGASFAPVTAPGVVQSAVHGTDRLEVGVTTLEGEVFYTMPGLDPLDISPIGRGISNLQRVFGPESTLYGHTAVTIERRPVPEPPKPRPPTVPPIPPPPNIDINELLNNPDQSLALLPKEMRVVLREGESTSEAVTLLLPAKRKADVVFLVDVSRSMDEEIFGLLEGLESIVNQLSASGLEVYMGVGEYRSHDDPPAFDLVHDIAPPGRALENALRSLNATGGGTETALAALYQMAVGDGQRGPNPMPPGEDASFRPGTLRVVVHATDEDLIEIDGDPTFEQVSVALRSDHVLHVGLSFENSDDPAGGVAGPPTDSLRRLSEETSAFSETAVDCDDDGVIDVQPGDPLVCALAPDEAPYAATMGPAIVRSILALEDRRNVSLVAGGDVSVVDGLLPQGVPQVDFKTPQALTFRVDLSCPRLPDDKTFDVALDALADGAVIAGNAIELVCRADAVPPVEEEEKRKKPAPPPALLPFVPLATLVPPLQPPQVLEQLSTQSQAQQQAQQQVQQQAQLQMNAALAPQEQEQPQLAYAYVNSHEPAPARAHTRGGNEFAFTEHSDGDTIPPQVITTLGAAVMGAIFAAAARTRTRGSRAYASVRRRATRRRF